ncbi:hypothetical protein DFH09DRAFT_1342698 [Mycena vulgaris]|nr:hypothetical protein DFH09DRAFT_1342698 [Mycena vulgaris]
MDSSSSQPQSPQLSSPSPSPNTAGMTPLAAPIIPPLYVDNLAKKFGLGELDLRKLRGLVQVVTVTGGTITQSDLASRLAAKCLPRLACNDARSEDDGFALTSDQKRNIRGIAQDTIHEATRTAFFTMHVDVLSTLKATAQKLDLDNIFGVPVREKKLVSTLKKTCSSIRDIIEPGDFVTLDKFTYATAAKKGGRIPKGQDFWSKTDAYLKEEVGKRGRNFTDPRWKVYIDQIIADDKPKFRGMTPGVPVSALMVHDPANGNGNAGAGVVANTSTGMTPAPFTFGSGEFGAFGGFGGAEAWGLGNAFNTSVSASQ